ncbi:SDR family NAD(P)-dependent oxidoreductase [Stakelama tenebrarum]|uniref:SDR family oxidoreductase n=1 Tax=Stakelama tenebrarum TaxID=2711215 RepID=A0A6G6Y1X1_9SPHN|nr:SDR family oxidoreductase [Sphingosinithalassobacter tenebrarum]QIG78922.1 SDR family oxidoreductase [Sphingosinithalassobacter tenebrarum]
MRDTGAALITGASAGLGACFAEALAARGYALILTARRGERLEMLAERLRADHGVTVSTIACDLARDDGVARLVTEIGRRGLAVDLLVNNAGFGLHGPFLDHAPDRIAAMIDLNCRAVAQLSRALLPGMVQMRRGGIIHVASVAAFVPGPWMAVYYASKAFVLSLSEALREEVRGKGVRIVALCPGPTATEFGAVSGIADSRAFRAAAGDVETVVRAALRAYDRDRAICIPGIAYRTMTAMRRFAPAAMTRRLVAMLQRGRGLTE